MICRIVTAKHIGRILTCLTFLTCYHECLMARDDAARGTQASRSSLHVKHILGLEGISKNANGDLSIQDGYLRFQKSNDERPHITRSAGGWWTGRADRPGRRVGCMKTTQRASEIFNRRCPFAVSCCYDFFTTKTSWKVDTVESNPKLENVRRANRVVFLEKHSCTYPSCAFHVKAIFGRQCPSNDSPYSLYRQCPRAQWAFSVESLL
jgi:hypothetical protein